MTSLSPTGSSTGTRASASSGNEAKVALVVEIDKPPEGFEVVGEYLDDLDLGPDDDDDADDDFEYDDAAKELERLDKGDRDEGEQMD